MIGPTHTRVTRTAGPMPAVFLMALDVEEAAHVLEVSSRGDTVTICIEDADKDMLIGYAVIGSDDNGMFTIYAARTMLGKLAEMALRAFFGVAQIAGKPLRVHAEKMQGFARMMGATDCFETVDTDGVKMGVFNG